MGLLSASASVTRYKLEGKLDEPIIDTISTALNKHAIIDIDGEPSEQVAGWTSFKQPYEPVFDGSNFIIGSYIVFSLRIDKKTIPSKLIQKRCLTEFRRRLHELKRDFLSRDEKKAIKESIIVNLSTTMPATPNIYDVVWQYEIGELWFFSNLKKANEQFETLFFKSFALHPIRLIPYTMASLNASLTRDEQDQLNQLGVSSQS